MFVREEAYIRIDRIYRNLVASLEQIHSQASKHNN